MPQTNSKPIPWPKEQELTQELFDAVAGEGAILIAYYSAREICVYRKVRHAGDRCDWEAGLA